MKSAYRQRILKNSGLQANRDAPTRLGHLYLLTAVHFTKRKWGAALILSKRLTEKGEAGEPRRHCDFRNALFTGEDHFFCFGQPALDDVLCDGHIRDRLKGTACVRLADRDAAAKLIDAEIFK